MNLDRYLSRRFHPRQYNCAHLVCDVWRDLKGEDLASVLDGFLCAPGARKTVLSQLRRIRFMDAPQSPCVVLMQSPKRAAHVGVWINRRVLHLLESGVQYTALDVASLGFKQVRFFTC